jgi:hypothetical protein
MNIHRPNPRAMQTLRCYKVEDFGMFSYFRHRESMQQS